LMRFRRQALRCGAFPLCASAVCSTALRKICGACQTRLAPLRARSPWPPILCSACGQASPPMRQPPLLLFFRSQPQRLHPLPLSLRSSPSRCLRQLARSQLPRRHRRLRLRRLFRSSRHPILAMRRVPRLCLISALRRLARLQRI
jgi:hypothetical protein